jgi:hypothetical protein
VGGGFVDGSRDVWVVAVSAEGGCHFFTIRQGGLIRVMTLPVPVNVCRIMIADVDGDGVSELVLARTDRCLHAYTLKCLRVGEDEYSYELVEKGRWEVPGQIGSMTCLHVGEDERPVWVIAQTGGQFMVIDMASSRPSPLYPQQQQLSFSSSDAETATELVAVGRDQLVTCTNDGILYTHTLSLDQNGITSTSVQGQDLELTHQLFSLHYLANTNTLVTCTWGGTTDFIRLDTPANRLRFQYPGRVAAFTVGILAGDQIGLVYVGFKNEVTVYYGVDIDMDTIDLIQAIKDACPDIEGDRETIWNRIKTLKQHQQQA